MRQNNHALNAHAPNKVIRTCVRSHRKTCLRTHCMRRSSDKIRAASSRPSSLRLTSESSLPSSPPRPAPTAAPTPASSSPPCPAARSPVRIVRHHRLLHLHRGVLRRPDGKILRLPKAQRGSVKDRRNRSPRGVENLRTVVVVHASLLHLLLRPCSASISRAYDWFAFNSGNFCAYLPMSAITAPDLADASCTLCTVSDDTCNITNFSDSW